MMRISTSETKKDAQEGLRLENENIIIAKVRGSPMQLGESPTVVRMATTYIYME